MIFWYVSSKGDIMPPNIFEQSFRFNLDCYVKLWLEIVAERRPYV